MAKKKPQEQDFPPEEATAMPNKSERIRQALADNPDMGPSEIAALLNQRNQQEEWGHTDYLPSAVSLEKSKLKKKEGTGTTTRSKGSRGKAEPGMVSVAALMDAKSLIESAGGKEEAKRLLDLLG